MQKQSFQFSIKKLRNISKAYLKSIFSKHKLPPGDRSRFDQLASKDRLFLLKRFSEYGQIFKTIWHENLLICVVGLKTSRKLLTENSDKLKAISVELRHIFPEGFIRNMRGDIHRKYRSYFANALKCEIEESNETQLTSIILHGLRNFSNEVSEPTASSYQKTLNTITTDLLINIFYGVSSPSKRFKSLLEKYNRLGPDGFVWHVGEEQRKVYMEIVSEVEELISVSRAEKSQLRPCVLSKLIEADVSIDETVIGNLIYMVEMGRFDMYSLFRWLTKFLVDHPEITHAISESEHLGLARAFVFETLRMEQSEGLIREATEDFVFDGYLIPKGAALRLCLWEPHKFEDPFTDPFNFNPKRFLDENYSIEQYTPFGLDQHRCPAGDMVIALSSLFVYTLVREFDIECLSDGPPFRGVYHWQPSKDFAVGLREKTLQT